MGTEVFPDVYTDSYQMRVGPFGANLLFAVTEHRQAIQPGDPLAVRPVAGLRMDVGTAKMLAFALARCVRDYERGEGVWVTLPEKALAQMNVSPEQWEAFWRGVSAGT